MSFKEEPIVEAGNLYEYLSENEKHLSMYKWNLSISAESYRREFCPLIGIVGRCNEMKKFFLFIIVLFLCLCPFAVQGEEVELMPQEEIAETPSLEPITEAEINALLGEDPYIGETDWRGNKVSTKRDYSKKRGKDPFKP